jgi:NAD(P)H-dependent FMN reductase
MSGASGPVRLLVTAGSERRGSFNRKLAGIASALAREHGADVTDLDLRALALPLYDHDIEAAGMPTGALRLRDLFAAHDAVLIAAPEYNGFVTPLLVNSFAWLSRVPEGDGQPSGLVASGGTVAGLVSASPGYYGGARALIALRSLLSMNLGLLVVPQTHSVPAASQAFDGDGRLVDARQRTGVERVVRSLLATARAMRGAS